MGNWTLDAMTFVERFDKISEADREMKMNLEEEFNFSQAP